MKEPQVLVTERAKLNLGSDSLRSKSSNQSVIDQVIEMLTAYVLKSDYNVDKAILNQQINDILSRLDNIPSMNIDDFLSLDSENPVQNKIITAALNAKPDKDTTYTAGTNVSIDSNNVISAVDTNYTAGNNVSIINNVISATDTTYTASDFDIKDLTDSTDLKSTWNNKQDQLTAGNNITIENNVISATGGDGLKQVDLATYADGVEDEIVQHIGSTTNDYTHGYIYKSHSGHVERYEDITIPAGSIKIVYTNKFDSSQKIVYSVEDIELDKSYPISYRMEGPLYAFNDTLKNNVDYWMNPSPISGTSILPDDNGRYLTLPYNSINNIVGLNTDINNLLNTHNDVLSRHFDGGYVSQVGTESIYLSLKDIVYYLRLPMIDLDTMQSVPNGFSMYLRMDKFKDYGYDLRRYMTEYHEFPKKWTSDIYDYDESRSNEITIRFEYPIMVDDLGNEFIFRYLGSSSQGSYRFYKTLNASGDKELFIVNNFGNFNLALKCQPITMESLAYTHNDFIDQDIYFNYDGFQETTTESITIRKKVTTYDDHGYPIDPVTLLWNRIDVQPANQLTAGDGITIEDNVISANLWTSVTD